VAVVGRALAAALVEEVLEQVVGAAREEQEPLHLRLNQTLEFDPGGALKSTPCKVEESAPAGPVPDLTIASPPPVSLLSRLGRRSWTSTGHISPSVGPRNLHNRTMADSSVASDSSVEVSRGEGKLCEEVGELEEQAAGAARAGEVAELAARVLATAPTFPGRTLVSWLSSTLASLGPLAAPDTLALALAAGLVAMGVARPVDSHEDSGELRVGSSYMWRHQAESLKVPDRSPARILGSKMFPKARKFDN